MKIYTGKGAAVEQIFTSALHESLILLFIRSDSIVRVIVSLGWIRNATVPCYVS